MLPGVTVEATSPALIERVRSVVTDEQGQYKIVDLRPGTYTVTFTLQGFSTVKREGIELTTGFTANVNGDMKVGALEETIVVTGASPVVDTQNVRKQNILSREILEAIPAAHTTQGWAAITLGVSVISTQQDVGGNRGESVTASSIHGNRAGDAARQLDGMGINTMLGTGGGVNYYYKMNDIMAQEVTVVTDGMSAEQETGGLLTNIVPRDGGNLFKVYSNFSFANRELQANNYSDELRNRGLASPPSVKEIYDAGVGVGGPILKDRVWFYTGHRRWGAQQEQANIYYNKTPHTLFYTPDLDRPAFLNNWAQDHSARITWQLTPKSKLNYFQSYQKSCTCDLTGSAVSAAIPGTPASSVPFYYDPVVLPQVTWNYAASNRLLFEVGGMYLHQTIESQRTNEAFPTDIGVTDIGLNLTYGASVAALTGLQAYSNGRGNQSSNGKIRASMSYVTGSHALKIGGVGMSGVYDIFGTYEQPYVYRFNRQVPAGLTQFATPHYSKSNLKLNLGIYGQDQWTINRLTLNLGVRFSYFNAYNPEQTRPAGPFTPALVSPRQDNVPNWRDIDPRVGAAYDLFGDGKTAIKAFFGRYVAAMASGLAQAANPANAMVTQTTRTWGDTDLDFVPDCDLGNLQANQECGRVDNLNFGTVVVNTRYADNILDGFGVRPYTWQGSVNVQHELRPNLALNVGYFRTSYGNFSVTDNLATEESDFTPFCLTVPANPGLPGGGGNQLCGLGDVSPARFGQVNNLVRQAKDINGKDISQVFNGVDVAMNMRFGRGGLLGGGISTGSTNYDSCDALTDVVGPATPLGVPGAWFGNRNFCEQTLGWASQTQLKFQGVYPLPWYGIQLSGTFQSLPGIVQIGTYAAANFSTNAAVNTIRGASTLGRDLAACSGVANCTAAIYSLSSVFEPGTQLDDRLNQVDLRIAKNFAIGRSRVQALVDIANVFNGSTVTQINSAVPALPPTTAASQFLSPRGILPGRLFKFGAQFNF